jgi:hypothetical protein
LHDGSPKGIASASSMNIRVAYQYIFLDARPELLPQP